MSGGFLPRTLANERLNKLNDLLLLAARQLRRRLEDLAKLAGSDRGPFGPRLTKDFLHTHAQDGGELRQQLAFGNASCFFPIDDVGVMDVELAGQLADRNPGAFAQIAQMRIKVDVRAHGQIIHRAGQNVLQLV